MKIKGHELSDILKFIKLNIKYSLPKIDGKKRAIIFSIPTHANIGDQAIVIAQNRFIQKYFKEYQIINVADYVTISAIRQLNQQANKDDLIFIQGGGSFGNLYPRADKDRRYILKYLAEYPIISFPQSTYFSNDCDGIKSYNKMANVLNKFYGKLLLIGRDKSSYRELRKLVVGDNVEVSQYPDIVLSMPVIKKIQNKTIKKVLLLIRNDKESSTSPELINELLNKLNERGIECKQSDMMANVQYIANWKQREKVVQNKLNEISNSDLVITDRLHGMILSYISDTNCIALNNDNGKVKNLYDSYLKECNYINFCDPNVNQIFETMDRISMTHEYVDFNQYFDDMADKIKIYSN